MRKIDILHGRWITDWGSTSQQGIEDEKKNWGVLVDKQAWINAMTGPGPTNGIVS